MSVPSWMKGAPISILLATDLSARSDRALDRAVLLAKQWRSHLTVLHVLNHQRPPLDSGDPVPSWRRPPDPSRAVRRGIAVELSAFADAASVLIEEGPVVETIMRIANSEASDLIVIGVARSALLDELMLGRTVDGLLRRSSMPLLVVKSRPRRQYRHIVVATDFSESSRHALVAAMRMFPEQRLTIFHAYDTPMSGPMSDATSYRREYQKIAEQDFSLFLRETEKLNGAGQQPRVLIEYGAPNHLLHDYVVDNEADLVVVGTHGGSAIFDIFIGSMAKRILNDVPCDILVVREPRARADV